MNAHKAIEFQVRGVAPLMMHNGHLADPLNAFAIAMKKISGKRNKTEADFQALADQEWEGGLYLDADRRVVIPGEVIEGVMNNAAGKMKLRTQVKAGTICDGNWRVVYSGPKDLDKLRDDPRFRDTRKVKIQRNSIMRTRPYFPEWSLAFVVHYLPDLLNESQVIDLLGMAGKFCGIGDFIPKHGRFEVVSHKRA